MADNTPEKLAQNLIDAYISNEFEKYFEEKKKIQMKDIATIISYINGYESEELTDVMKNEIIMSLTQGPSGPD